MSNFWKVFPTLIASRAIVDKIELKSRSYDELSALFKEVESWVDTFKTLDPDKPHTYIGTAVSVLKRITTPAQTSVPAKRDLLTRFSDEMNLVKIDEPRLIPFYQNLAHLYMDDSKIIYEDANGELHYLPLEDCEEGFFFFHLREVEKAGEKDVDIMPLVPSYSMQKQRRKKLNKALAKLFWKHFKMLDWAVSEKSMDFSPSEPRFRAYEGELTELFGTLQKYKEQGTRRALLFDGGPGTGKSTLAYNLAQALSDRTLYISHETISWLTKDDWEYLLDMFQPEMIIVDDIDRIDGLSRKLFLFDETYCQVPFIVLTSNEWKKIPDAFKRPGRIDCLISMEVPSIEIRREIIMKMAEFEQVEVPKYRLDLLAEIHHTYTGAFIVELLRRVRVEGWDYQIPSYDSTFRELSQELRDKWNLGEPVKSSKDLNLLDIDLKKSDVETP